MLILYDAIGTLADSVGTPLNESNFVQVLMPLLLTRYSQLSDDDQHVFPLLECLTSIASALGPGFAPFVAPIWTRCLEIISLTYQQWQLHLQHPDQYLDVDKDYIVVSLDLLSGIAQGMGTLILPYVRNSQPPLLPMLVVCLKDVNSGIRQSGFALLGDLTINAFEVILPGLSVIMPLVISSINPNLDNSFSSVVNNATWSAGEIAIQWRISF